MAFEDEIESLNVSGFKWEIGQVSGFVSCKQLVPKVSIFEKSFFVRKCRLVQETKLSNALTW